MKNKILLISIIIELSIIIILFRSFHQKNSQILGALSVNPIQKKDIIFTKVEKLKYFYEPEPNKIQTIEQKYLEKLGYPSGSVIRYTINADGLNQRPNYTVDKPNNVYRIVALGDSLTFGVNLNTEDNYPSQLEGLFNDRCNGKTFQILNLGEKGYDIQYAVTRYRLRGMKYNPDLVLWLIIGDDLLRITELTVSKSEYYEKEMKKTGEYEQLFNEGIFLPARVRAREEVLKELGEDNIIRYQERYLRELNQYFKGKLVIFTFSSVPEKYKNILRQFKNSRQETFFYNDLPALDKEKGELFPDFHPTKKGYSIIVENLFNYLTQNKVIPCN